RAGAGQGSGKLDLRDQGRSLGRSFRHDALFGLQENRRQVPPALGAGRAAGPGEERRLQELLPRVHPGGPAPFGQTFAQEDRRPGPVLAGQVLKGRKAPAWGSPRVVSYVLFSGFLLLAALLHPGPAALAGLYSFTL